MAQAQPKNDRIRTLREFESKVFLLFALRLMYRHYVRSPMINNWIAKLNREVQADRKGRRKRTRGPLIRFGKKIIEALFRNKAALASELRKDYTSDANSSINNRARMYGSDQYGYTEQRARKALSEAVQAFARNRPTKKLPVMQDKAGIEFEKDRREFEESFLHDPEQAENCVESGIGSWDTPFRRPSEEDVNALLANACDDNGYSEDKFDNPPSADSTPAPTPAETRADPQAPARAMPIEQSYFPGFEPIQVATHTSRQTRSKWAYLRTMPEDERG